MRTMLLFPPTWHPSQPYLSLPSLTGFLKQEGVTDAIQRDLGIEVLDSFLSHATGRETYERMQENPYLEVFRSRLVPDILAQTPDLVGVSITATSQILPGLTLCRLLKQAHPDLHLTIGGSIFTRLVDNLRRVESMFQFADDFVVFEGETALLELIHQLEGKRDFSKVPNLIYRQNGKIIVNQPFFSENINALSAPNFDGFPFRQYLAPQSVLPIQFSRGCYYKDCAFCALTLDHQNFRQRAPEKVVDDVKGLMERYQTPFFFFTDECFALSPTKRLCRQLIEAGVNAQWTCEMRFEKNLTRDLLKLMRDAGCLKIVFGLETYNMRVMDFMKKGIQREHVNRIVDDCLDLDIAVHCYVLIGFPTETEAEAMETANFIRRHTRLQSSYGCSCQPCLFDLEKEAPIMSDAAGYGIRRIMRPASEDLSLGYFYEVMEGMKPDEAERVYQHVYEKVSEVVCELPFNYSMADGLLYIARAKTHPVATG